jgi:predicted nucleotidyltransferase component of viral defense system
MITSGEIQRIASKHGLRDTQIEKDYVIGWVLFGISKNDFLKSGLAFKGGTAIRKFYIKDYRLSEDIDFTYVDGKMDEKLLKAEFENVLYWVKKESRINLEIRDEKLHQTGNYNFYIGYVGPLGGKVEKKDIKIDICDNEKMCNRPCKLPAINEYSDLSESYEIECYTEKEIISEKMRSLMQRTMPRDLFDLWYFFEKANKDILDYVSDFQEKTKFKKLDPYKFVKTVNDKQLKYKSNWEKNLEMQIKEIPGFDSVWRELSRHFNKFENYMKN